MRLIRIESNIGKIGQKQKKDAEEKLGNVKADLLIFISKRFVMLDTNFKEYLDDEFGRILPEHQNKYRELFKKLGFSDVNHDFVEFWSIYGDEIYGKIGYLVDLAMDFEDFPSSQTEVLRKNLGLPDNYFSLLNDELDDYILYDKNTDEVFLLRLPIFGNLLKINSSINIGIALNALSRII